MALMLTNFASTTLSSSLASGATSAALTSVTGFPDVGAVLDANYYYAVVQDTLGVWEIVKVRAASASAGAATLTVARAQEGSSSPVSFASGSAIYVPLTLQNFQDYVATIAAIFPTQTGNSGKALVTDGSTVSWGLQAAPPPSTYPTSGAL